MLRIFCISLLLIACSALLDAEGLVGKDAPAFNAKNCLTEPDARTLADCKGDVIVLRFW